MQIYFVNEYIEPKAQIHDQDSTQGGHLHLLRLISDSWVLVASLRREFYLCFLASFVFCNNYRPPRGNLF